MHVSYPVIMMKKTTFILLLLLLTGSVALGSHGGGGGSGGGSSGGGNASAGDGGGSASTRAGNYDVGRTVFFSKLHCGSCPLSGLVLNRQSAAPLIPMLKSGGELGKLLRFRERYAVRYFLKKRFNL